MMWDFGKAYTDHGSAPMASLHAMHEIHVLLVDHESESLIHTAKQLELCNYRVTVVELASAAISMLFSGTAKFDVVIANINSPDLHGFKLLQQAVVMALPIVLMSVDDNAFMAMRALESGAFLYIKKPATMEILRYLWQLVMREKTRMIRERELFVAANCNININGPAVVENPNLVEVREAAGEIENPEMMRNKGSSKKKKAMDELEECDHSLVHHNNVRKKMCTEWTHELHAKFMNAVDILGEGRCFPKEILELMNVPGLTRMQVASHLQKCRNDNWKSPEERKAVSGMITQLATNQGDSNESGQLKPRRFGSKPQLVGKISQVQQARPCVTETPNMELNADSTLITTFAAYHHKKYGTIGGSGPRNGSSSNPRHSSDDFFNFPEKTNFNLSSGRHLADHPNPATRFGPAYNDKQVSLLCTQN